jgi:hypothetical protein
MSKSSPPTKIPSVSKKAIENSTSLKPSHSPVRWVQIPFDLDVFENKEVDPICD